MSSQASLLSSSSFSYGWEYDVFLSFRGEDTRHGFTGNLYNALHNRGIRTFIDHEELHRGDEITPSLLNAIEESRIAIIVLSPNYASSSFCLDELVHILHCIKQNGRLVLPIFYKVDPSDVRHQRGSYEDALVNHEEKFKANKETFEDNMKRLQKWKTALQQVANLCGFHFEQQGKVYEYKLIENIVKEVSNKINRAPLHVADYPVGLESNVRKVISLLNLGSDEVHMIGIHGISGIGKSTIARAIYNAIADSFEGLCFLDNVRENSIAHLQETLLLEIVGEKDIKLASVHKGIPIIKHRLHRKKVLLVFDNVDKLEQLMATAGGPDWFGSGSRIIITTQDMHLLRTHGVERTYELHKLNEKQALELLCWHAFKTETVDPHYVDILNRAVTYASGHPLALEVIGSDLFGKTIEEWESALDQYEKIPEKRILNILKVSFYSLEECQQKMFLDIACCFKGYDLANVKKILHGHHGLSPDYGIRVLIEKSLIKINVYDRVNHVTLHDLIEAMGKEIVRLEAPEEPGKRSRLWFREDIVQILEENMGSSVIQIMVLDLPEFEVVEWDGNGFKDMKTLKTLIIRKAAFSEGPKHLPNSLRVLQWWGYPSPSFPSNFNPKNLVMLELSQSPLPSIDSFMSKKKFVNMKVMKFDDCQGITEIPDVSVFPSLEELSFERCDNLIRIHESVGFLNKLKILNANGCKKFSSFPPIKLPLLEELNLSSCHSLENFPEILGKMEKITTLDLNGTPIEELPFSIQNLTRLQRLVLTRGRRVQSKNTISMMRKLDKLIVGEYSGFFIRGEDKGDATSSLVFENTIDFDHWHCNIVDEFIRKGLPLFDNVQRLELSRCNFTILPACIKEYLFLTEIYLYDCESFREIEGIPLNLETFRVEKCKSLKDLDLTLFPECFTTLDLNNCENLQEIRGISPNIRTLRATECPSLTSECRSMLLNQELHEEGGDKVFILPETRIPEWFEHRFNEESISFRFRNMIPAISLCFAFLFTGKITDYCHNIEVNGMPEVIRVYFSPYWKAGNYTVLYDIKPEKYLRHDVLNLEENIWNYVKCTLSNSRDTVFLEKSGIHVFKLGRNMKDIEYIDQQNMVGSQTGEIILEGAARFFNASTSSIE